METADAALGGAVRLFQAGRGFRYSVDAVLLARFAAEKRAKAAYDFCAGNGVVGLCLLALDAARQVAGVDLSEEELDRARRSAAANGVAGRFGALAGDLRRAREFLPAQSADLVTANPPYGAAGQGRQSPDPALAAARHEQELTLAELLDAAAYALKERGAFCAVYPARRLAALLAECRRARLAPKVLRLVHPRRGQPASLALVRCVKGGGEGLEVRAPLYLHPETGGQKYSREATRLLSGAGVAATWPGPGG